MPFAIAKDALFGLKRHSERIRLDPSQRPVAVALLGGAVALGLSVALCRRGVLLPEACIYLPHYLGLKQSLAQKIFDPKATDLGFYQARELSYLFDFLDCQVIAACAAHGFVHFLSLSHYLFSIAGGFLIWLTARRLGMPAPESSLATLLFLTCPMVILGGSYYRSAKMGVTLCLLLLGLILASIRRAYAAEAVRPWHWLAVTATLLAASLFDRQGFFLSLVFCAIFFTRSVAGCQRHEFPLLICGLTAVIVAELYNRVIAPALIYILNGYRPSFAFQQFDFREIFHEPTVAARALFYGPQLSFRYAAELLGSIPWPVVAVAAAGTSLWWLRGPAVLEPQRLQPANGPSWPDRCWPLLLVCLLPVMTGIMGLRLAPVLVTDLRLTYYGLPVAGVTILAILFSHETLAAMTPARWRVSAFGILILCNVLVLLDDRAVIEGGIYRESYYAMPKVFEALSNPAGSAKGNSGIGEPLIRQPLPGHLSPGQEAVTRLLIAQQNKR